MGSEFLILRVLSRWRPWRPSVARCLATAASTGCPLARLARVRARCMRYSPWSIAHSQLLFTNPRTACTYYSSVDAGLPRDAL